MNQSESHARAVLVATLDKALAVQQPAIEAYAGQLRVWSQAGDRRTKLRNSGRDGSPAAAIRLAEKQYLAAVASMGAGVGAAAAAPGVGTGIGLIASTAELGGNLQATAMFVLTLAYIHDVPIDDLEYRRALLTAVLLGNSGTKVIEKVAGRTGPHWAKAMISGVPRESIRAVNRVLGRNFVTLYGTKEGILVLGKAVPFGLGAAIGGVGNGVMGGLTVRAARKAFGPPPVSWPEETNKSNRSDGALGVQAEDSSHD